jgi:hypothetical protein
MLALSVMFYRSCSPIQLDFAAGFLRTSPVPVAGMNWHNESQASHGRACHLDACRSIMYGETLMEYTEGGLTMKVPPVAVAGGRVPRGDGQVCGRRHVPNLARLSRGDIVILTN